jgi:hypothetical protein
LNPAIVDDLRSRWYPNTLDDPAAAVVAQTWLDAAWRRLQRDSTGIVARIESGLVAKVDVVDVLTAATLRVLQNPQRYTRESVTIDDYSHTGDRDPASVSNDLYFTASELRSLAGQGDTSGAWTAKPWTTRSWSCWT